MILVIDNYDSFTYNLVDLVQAYQAVKVVRNDDITIEAIEQELPDGILISPGPGRPADGGISVQVVKQFYDRIPLLGVCLGHQMIGEVFGAKLVHATRPMHGHTSAIQHDGRGLFKGLPTPLKVMRYHSLVLEPQSIPSDLYVTAKTETGEVMALQHRTYPVFGVQFHPESILTEAGRQLIGNWVEAFAAKQVVR